MIKFGFVAKNECKLLNNTRDVCMKNFIVRKKHFLSNKKIKKSVKQVIPSLTIFHSFNMRQFPSDVYLEKINNVINDCLNNFN